MSDQKTEQKHTPGPWRYWPCKVDSQLTPPMYDYVQFASPIGHVFRAPIEFLSEADARLLAAAPELLEAAKLVIAWYEAEDDHSKADFYERMQMCRDSEAALRAAIAKATGGPRHD